MRVENHVVQSLPAQREPFYLVPIGPLSLFGVLHDDKVTDGGVGSLVLKGEFRSLTPLFYSDLMRPKLILPLVTRLGNRGNPWVVVTHFTFKDIEGTEENTGDAGDTLGVQLQSLRFVVALRPCPVLECLTTHEEDYQNEAGEQHGPRGNPLELVRALEPACVVRNYRKQHGQS